jgi:hypothetical protein
MGDGKQTLKLGASSATWVAGGTPFSVTGAAGASDMLNVGNLMIFALR